MLKPNAYLKNVQEITIELLQKNQIKALILDVDNTLIDYDCNLSSDIINWANNLKNSGIKLYILSNTSHEEKVKNVAEKLEIKYKKFAKKPFKKGFLSVKKELGLDEKNIAVVGDQIFTDVIGGNRCNMFTILVDPLDKKDYWYTAIKRPIENIIKKKFKRGE